MLAEILYLSGVVGLVFWFMLVKNNQSEKYKIIPGPPTIPLLGNAWLFLIHWKEPLELLCYLVKKYGSLVKTEFRPLFPLTIIVTDYEIAEFLLSSSEILDKSTTYVFVRPWLGTGLLTADGEKWRKLRRILNPAFHVQILDKFISIFESKGDILAKKLEEETGEYNIDVNQPITDCSLDVICESLMGIDVNAQNDRDSSYVHSVKEMCRIINERMLSAIQMTDMLYPLARNYYTQKKVLKILHEKSNAVINQRRKELNYKNGSNITGEKSKKPFMDHLLGASMEGRPLTQEEIREEVDTFLFAGHDTTAAALGFTLFCLANHPKVQERVFEEQVALFGGNKTPNVTYADLREMKYLENVIKEALRLYPPVPIIGRKLVKEVKHEGKVFQKCEMIIFIYGLHRNPKYYKNPDDFDPSRFDNDEEKCPYALLSFSSGPRNCIGQKFAMLELKSIISKIVRRFELQPAIPGHVLHLEGKTVLKSRNGVKLRLKLRQ